MVAIAFVGDWSGYADRYRIDELFRCVRAISRGGMPSLSAYPNLIEFRAILSIEIRNNMPAKKKKNDVLVVGDSEDGNSEVAKGGDGLIGNRISD